MEMSGHIYRCAGGETFDSIALNVYGDEKYAAEMMCANPERVDSTVFLGGEELRLPVVYVPRAAETGGHAPASAPWKE